MVVRIMKPSFDLMVPVGDINADWIKLADPDAAREDMRITLEVLLANPDVPDAAKRKAQAEYDKAGGEPWIVREMKKE